MDKIEEVVQRVYNPIRLYRAWEQVKKNNGAPGVDRVSIEEFEGIRDERMKLITDKLRKGQYRFKPSRRVEIDKPGSTKKRKLNIPTVMDRVVGCSIYYVLEELYDNEFTKSNFGFRRGKSQHRAIRHLKDLSGDGYEWCVSIDLKGFFDGIPHQLIFRLLRKKIKDERFITLIARALKNGVMVNGELEKTTEGCAQGSPLSPILSNIVLHELDKELEARGHRYCRWADDFVILTKSERAAKRVMESISEFIEGKLGLEVNREKSVIAPLRYVEFLGFRILRGKIQVGMKAREKFKTRVRELTRRNNPYSMNRIVAELNSYLKGWQSYFGIQEFKKLFGQLDEFIRNRLRSMQLKKWKKPRKFQQAMIRAGVEPAIAKRTWIQMRCWNSIHRMKVRFILNLKWFRNLGLYFLKDYTKSTFQIPLI